MHEKKDWDRRYDEDDLPWDTGRPDVSLMNLLAEWPTWHGRILEVGCGTGTNAVWLAEHGFEVTALDLSGSAVALAEQRRGEHGVNCRLLADNFLTCSLQAEAFDLLFDRGCFHSVHGEEERGVFVRQAAACLGPGGLWFSLIGNKDQVLEGQGPPRMSAAEICTAVEPAFEVLRLRSVLRNSARRPMQLRFWECLMRRR